MALIVTPQFLPLLGGMERECALLAREFARRGYEAVILTEDLGMGLPSSEREGAALVLRVPSSPTRSLGVQLRVALRIAWNVFRLRRRVAFAVVRTTTLPALVMGLLKLLRIARFPTLVTAETGGEEDDVAALAQRPLFRASRLLVSANDALNGICRANVEHLHEHGFPEHKISEIPNGVDTSPFATAEPPSRVRRFLFLGRIETAKGVFELLDAVRSLTRRHPDVSLTVAGDGPSRRELEERATTLGLDGTVRFVGRVPYEQLGRLFSDTDCLVLPSHSEGMPLSVLEAAAHRRVMIISQVGDIPALFGSRIRTFPPRDARALEAAMEAAVEDPSPSADYHDVIELVGIGAVADRILGRLGVAGAAAAP